MLTYYFPIRLTVIVFVAIPIAGQGVDRSHSQTVIDFCKVVRQIDVFNGQVVALQGYVEQKEDWAILRDTSCESLQSRDNLPLRLLIKFPSSRQLGAASSETKALVNLFTQFSRYPARTLGMWIAVVGQIVAAPRGSGSKSLAGEIRVHSLMEFPKPLRPLSEHGSYSQWSP